MKIVDLEKRLRLASLLGYKDRQKVYKKSGIYAGWLNDEKQCLYIGKATAKPNGTLFKRIGAHYSGQRGSDQFCLYIFDSYLKASLPGVGARITKKINNMTAAWIQEAVSFKCVEEDEKYIDCLERELRKRWKPILNPL